MEKDKKMSRRDWLASMFAGMGLFISYGLLATEGLLFVLPEKRKPKMRKLFAGRIEQYEIGAVQKFYDLKGGEILVKRDKDSFKAFSSTCPHLGCKVRWEPENEHFFCPCHRGVFRADGIAISGPPAEAGQSLSTIQLDVNETSGVIYIEVEDIPSGRRG